MEQAALSLLEAATHKSIHAAAFTRASSHATSVLNDLLSRYISLLAATTAKYAQHAGRSNVTCVDAIEALEEMGFSLEDLVGYMREAAELKKYAVFSRRRVEELTEFRARMRGDEEDEELEDENEDDEPPLKRPRTDDYYGHIPDHMPPLPEDFGDPDSPRAESPAPMETQMGPSNPSALVPQLTATSTTAADYLQPIPYDQSSLSEVPSWHLPGAAPPAPHRPSAAPTETTDYALYKAFHHILKNPQRTPGQPTPSRHRVMISLLQYSQYIPRWELPDSMYAISGHAAPRAWPVVPTFAQPIDDSIAAKRFPAGYRTVSAPDRIVPSVGAQTSRLPELTKRVLPQQIYKRVSTLGHPPPLTRGPKLLTYGSGVSAPWNTPDNASQEKEGPPRMPNARVFATWDYDVKDFRVPLKKPRPNAPVGQAPPPVAPRKSSRAAV
ncbi:BTP domain-containing protein [Mycena kentingensis (nom. inval.)]|nr:BTP domain-containing protein [Mycena kentingensis (nom. inval.)]